MPFVIVGAILLGMKIFEIGPVAEWPWWAILTPFGLAVAWWVYADTSGLTQRRAMRRMEERKIARRERDMEALGLTIQSDRRKRAARSAADEARERSQAKGKPD